MKILTFILLKICNFDLDGVRMKFEEDFCGKTDSFMKNLEIYF